LQEIVRLEKITKIYRLGQINFKALDNIDLMIYRGDIIALMGPSGSGKTSLLNIIGLLDRPSSGKIFLDDKDVSELSDKEIAYIRNQKIGFVFQFFNLINRLTVYENIELPLIPRGVPRDLRRKMIIEALEKVSGDISWLYKKPTQLSGGQQQRVAIARAIVGRPEIILADEPTGNLDRASAKTVISTFLDLNKLGHTIIIVTHDPEVANCTNLIYEMRDGKIISTKDPQRDNCLIYKKI
jgi:putative ABC transport system ATP-binding protein